MSPDRLQLQPNTGTLLDNISKEHLTYPILVEYPQILLLVSRNLGVDTVGMVAPLLGVQAGGGGEGEGD